MKFQVEWQEEVLDAFDAPEGVYSRPSFEVQAANLEEALKAAESEARRLINEARPDQSHGWFSSRILTLTDEDGTRNQINKKEALRDGSFVIVEDS